MTSEEQNQQTAQSIPTPVDNASPHNCNSTTVEGISPSVTSSPIGAKDDTPTPPAFTFPSTGKSALPASKQGEKRKAPEDETDASASTSTPNKQVKVSKTIIDCPVALEVLGVLKRKRSLDSGKILAWALNPNDPDFLRIHEYVKNSKSGLSIKILSILRIVTAADKLEDGTSLDFNKHPDADHMHRMMLWHGTPYFNVFSILENGFRTPSYGPFGTNTGIFFADRIAKSIQYCRKGFDDDLTEYLFLSDVLLGIKGSWHSEDQTNVSSVGGIKCRSQKRVGSVIPETEQDVEVEGCIWPLGSDETKDNERTSLDRTSYYYSYNEFIVYNKAQVQPKFLIKVEFPC